MMANRKLELKNMNTRDTNVKKKFSCVFNGGRRGDRFEFLMKDTRILSLTKNSQSGILHIIAISIPDFASNRDLIFWVGRICNFQFLAFYYVSSSQTGFFHWDTIHIKGYDFWGDESSGLAT